MAKLSLFSHFLIAPPHNPGQNFTFAPSKASFYRHKTTCSVSSTSTKPFEIPWGCEIESLESASELQEWLSSSGLPPQKMGIDRVEIGERGLVALNNIRKGEKLLFVPPPLVITADSEWTLAEAGNILKSYSVPDWPLIATYLISEASLMKSSRTRSELDQYLAASQVRERAIERINDVTGTYDDLKAQIFSKHPEIFPEKVFNMESFRWSFGILFSRLVRLPSMDGKVALVPWADMLNHSSEVETFLDYDKASMGIVFTTDRPYQPGEQVFISYGKKSNGELLLSYGFVPKEGMNPNDSVELSLSLDDSDKCYKEKLEALKKHGLTSPQRFPLQITGWPVEMMAYAYLVVSPPEMGRKFAELAAAASSRSRSGLSFPELEEQALQFISDCSESSISKYTKFLEGSTSFDPATTNIKQANRKLLLKQLATDLCTSERRILYRTQYILRRRLRDLRKGELKALSLFSGFRRFFKEF